MNYPSFIKENDCIGVPAPSAGADCAERINKSLNAKKTLEKLSVISMAHTNVLREGKIKDIDETGFIPTYIFEGVGEISEKIFGGKSDHEA